MAQERPAALVPHVKDFIKNMLAAMLHSDSDVAIEATTFWMQYLEVGLPRAELLPVLPELVVRLLQHMVFEEHDEEVVAAQEAERGIVHDGATDLKPFAHDRDAAEPCGVGGAGGEGSADVSAGGLHPLLPVVCCLCLCYSTHGVTIARAAPALWQQPIPRQFWEPNILPQTRDI